MVAVVNPTAHLNNAIHYNENKLKEGKAKLIHAKGYAKDTHLLGFTDKVSRLRKLISLNDRTKVNTLHISLNFHPSEKFTSQQLSDITDAYMTKLGFGDQPYLVYQHFDAAHPHVHVVTVNIKSDGSPINLHLIGAKRSEPARKAVEKDFRLVRAEDQTDNYLLEPVSFLKVQYSKTETKRGISRVLRAVLPSYKYTSLAELNAVLGLYNVLADRGGEDSRTFKTGGLVYRVLENGVKVGRPIKASDFAHKATLKELTKKFEGNETARLPYKASLKATVDKILLRPANRSMPAFIQALLKEKVQLVLRQNASGLIYGLTYIDHNNKTVFNGSDLGKGYSAAGVQKRFADPTIYQEVKVPAQKVNPPAGKSGGRSYTPIDIPFPGTGLLDALLQVEDAEALNSALKEDERRRKKKKRHRID